LFPDDADERLREQYGDLLIRPQGQQVFISGDQVVGTGGQGASDNHVIVGITADSGKGGEGSRHVGKSSEEGAEFLHLFVSVPVTRSEMLTLQEDRLGFLQDAFTEIQVESSSYRVVEELGGKALFCQEGAYQDGGVQDDLRHAVF